MNLKFNTLKGSLILVSALTIVGCSGKQQSEVVEKTPDLASRQEVVQPKPRPQEKLQTRLETKVRTSSQPKSVTRSKSNCLPVSLKSCWIWKSFQF